MVVIGNQEISSVSKEQQKIVMPSKQHLEDQFEKLLARRVLANAWMGMTTKAWKGSDSSEELEDQAAATVVKPPVLGKRVRANGESGVDRAGE